MNKILFISIEEAVIIHEKMIEIGGGASGIRSLELLHSAIERPKASFSGTFLYDSILTMGGSMLQSLVKNHPFVDGNKRTAFFATLRFFEKNNYVFRLEQKDIVDFMVKVASQNLSVENIAAWFNDRLVE